MTAGLGRGLALAGTGVVVGLAIVVALFGSGDLSTRLRGAVTPGNTSRSVADLPKNGPAGSDTIPDTPAANRERPHPGSGDPAAVDPAEKPLGENPLAGPDGAPQGESRRAEAARTPSLDILRVEPSGETVLAGRGAPKASVELLRDNRTVARATADDAGQFAIDGLTLPPGNSELTLRSTAPDGRTTEGRASAVVVVDRDRKAQPLVAVSEADKPTRVLSMPSTAAARTAEGGSRPAREPAGDAGQDSSKPAGGSEPAAVPPRREAALPGTGGRPDAPGAGTASVKIVSVDAQEGGRLFVSGQGAAWTSLRLYLNDTLVASGRSGADGRVSFTIGRGVKPGGYQIRIDQVDDASGKVGQRAQVGFTFPTQLAAKDPVRTAAKPEAQSASPATAKPSADAPPAMAAGAAGPAADMRAAEALSPKVPGAGRLPGSDARAATPPSPAPPPGQTTRKGLPTHPPGAPPRLAESPSSTVPSADMAATAPPPPKPADQPGAVFVPEIDTARITRGDNLWQISRRSYGDGKRYTVIYDANRDQIRDPNLIYPGQIFVMPKDLPAAERPGAKRG